MLLTTFCSRCLLLIGIHPNYPLRKSIIIFNNTIMLSSYILGLVNFYLKREAESVESICIFLIIHINYLALIFGRKAIKSILTATDRFLEIKAEDADTRFLLQYLRRVETLVKFLGCAGTLAFTTKPFVLNDTSMFKLYKPPQIPLYMFHIYEFYIALYVGTSYTFYNIFICSLIVWITVQFRSLNLSIKALNLSNRDKDTCISDMKRIIKYHQFLIRYAEDLNELLSTPFAFLIIIGVAMMCMEMYVLSVSNGVITIIKAVVVTSCLITEYFSVYSLPAQLLMNQSGATADMIYYELEWYLPHVVPLRKYLLFMVIRSQKEVFIRAGGYHVVNCKTLLIMLKTSYSFFTFLQTVSNE